MTWTVQRRDARELSLKALKVEVQAGTSQAESAPGTAIFDNFKLETNVYGWMCDNIYQGGSIMAMEETGSTSYLLSDRQGSKRLVMNSSGGVMARHDYYPFGESIQAGVGLRTSGQGFGATDQFRSRFAGTEGDPGTGLEPTLWRKLESRSGRWTSVDPYRGSMRRGDPQTFNRYSYTGNDPVNRVDPSGQQEEEFIRIYVRGAPWPGGGSGAGLISFVNPTYGPEFVGAPMIPPVPPQTPPQEPCNPGEGQLPLLVRFNLRDESGTVPINPYIHRAVAQDFQNALNEINAAVPGGIGFTEVFRTTEYQTTLHNRWIAGGRRGNPVATPGTSRHESGFAIDVPWLVQRDENGYVRDRQGNYVLTDLGRTVIPIFERYGFAWGGSFNDPPHFQADPTLHGYNSRQDAIRASQGFYSRCLDGR